MKSERKSLRQLFVPICLELICFMLAGMVDTLMLSTVSDQVVGAVGTSNSYISIFIIMFSIISTGMIAVMTQYIGAKKESIAIQACKIGAVFNLLVGIVFSVILFFFAGNILDVIGIASALREPAVEYMKIVGGGVVLNAMIPIFSSCLRSFGHTKWPMYATLFGNAVNIVLNAVFLFGLQMGVKGVAIATVISRVVNLIIVIWAARKLFYVDKDAVKESNRYVFGQIIKIGLPSALETALYNLAMIFVVRFLNQMDADGLNVTARSYAMQIINFSFCVGAALAQANAIIVGWRLGAKEYDECDRGTNKAAVIGIIAGAGIALVLAFCGKWIIPIFTDDPLLISLVTKILYVDVVLEVGRVTNLVYGNALKTSGDAVFPMIIAAIFMYLCAVGGTYILGVKMELLVVGAYIGMAMDECIRAICMFARWKRGKWRSKSIA